MRRRDALAGLLGALLASGCPAPAPAPVAMPVPPPPPPPDRMVPSLAGLLPFAGLKWLISLRPERLARTEWLRAPVARLVADERLDLLARATGLDLRAIPEMLLAGYGEGAEEAVMWLVRHRHDPLLVERRFRERLTGGEARSALGHQLVGVWGQVGTATRGFVSIGRDVSGFQYGGDRRRGPARIALLYAQGELEGIPTALEEPALARLDAELGLQPLKLLVPGPFEGEVARGLRGLMAGAYALGASLAPNDPQALDLRALLIGDYGPDADRARAVELLRTAWDDFGKSDLGHLLGAHQPLAPPVVEASPSGLSLRAALDAATLFRGLSAATVDDVREIMR